MGAMVARAALGARKSYLPFTFITFITFITAITSILSTFEDDRS
jgi:hypothetical protein